MDEKHLSGTAARPMNARRSHPRLYFGPDDVEAPNAFAAGVTWRPVPGARYYSVHAADTPAFAPAQCDLLYSPPVGTQRAIDSLWTS